MIVPPPPLDVSDTAGFVAVGVLLALAIVVSMVEPVRVPVVAGVRVGVRVGVMVAVAVTVGVADGLNAPYTVFAGPERAIISMVSIHAPVTPPMPTTN